MCILHVQGYRFESDHVQKKKLIKEMKVKKYKSCRHLDSDIWGTILGKGKLTKISLDMQQEYIEQNTRRAVYTLFVSKLKKKKRLSLYGKLLYNRRKVCLFYGNMTRSAYKYAGVKEGW